MKDKLREAFDQVRADEEMKNRTMVLLSQKTKGYTRWRAQNYRWLVPAMLCMLFLFAGGKWLYFTPMLEISIDINPSIELGVNRFDRIISVKGYNRDGEKLSDSLNVKYMNYTEAVNEVLQNETIVALLGEDEIMTIGVIGTGEAKSMTVLSNIESCTAGEKNAYCYYANAQETEAAHEMGLSCGKYRAFTELRALDPNVTAEEIRNMTMREIRNRIDELSGEGGNGTDAADSSADEENTCRENPGRKNAQDGHHGKRHKHRHSG